KPVLDAIRYKSTISEASFSADGTRLVTATFLHANTVRLWEAGGRQAAELVHLLKPENTATVWQLPEGKRITSVGESGAPTLFRHASLGHDGARLLLIQDGAAQIRDADTGQLIRSVHKPGTAVIGCALSPKNRILVTANDDRTAQLWDAATGENVPTPRQFRHNGQTWPPLFSPDGGLLVMTSQDGIRIWDASTGDPISPPLIHPLEVECVAFSPDGRRLVTASDHAARVWPVHGKEREVEELLQFAEFLSCARTDSDVGRLVQLSSDELASA